MTTRVEIDAQLIEQRIAELARHGAHGETGVWRTVYSPEWVETQRTVERWMRDAGLETRWDAVGNVWGRVEGTDGGKSVATGSHIDTQTPGGRFDGALGIVAGLTAVEALIRQHGRPRRTLEVVSLCEEESSRFPSANFWGSRAIAGETSPEDIAKTVSFDGEPIGEAMRSVGLDPDRIPEAKRDDIGVFVELHIEQGPILEQAGLPVAIVTGITGLRHYRVTVRGVSNHAGAFPMDLRRDPMAAASEMITGVINTAHRMGRPAVTTVGRIAVEPNFPAIVPDAVTFMVDARHPDPAQRQLLYRRHEALIREVAERRNVEVTWDVLSEHAPQPCAPDLVELFDRAASDLGIPHIRMASGAVHDTQRLARQADAVMIFVQSKDGRSHTPAEFTSTAHAQAGVEILAAGLHEIAYEESGG